MKVWLLTTEYPPFFGGGIGTYCAHTVRMLVSRGHQVTVFVNDDTIGREWIETTDGATRIVRFTHLADAKPPCLGHVAATSLKLSEVVEAFIRREGPPDIIESQEFLGLPYFLLQKKKTLWPEFQAIPIVITLHSPTFVCKRINQEPLYRLPDYWIGEMERFCIRAADLVISPSRYLVDEIKRSMYLDESVPVIIPHPFEEKDVFGETAGRECQRNEHEIVFLGRLEYLKGVIQLLNYFVELWEEKIDVRLRLVGGDTLFHPKNKMMSEFLRTRYRRYFSEGLVTYEGLVQPSELPGMINRASAVVVPSLTESFSYSVLECMSLGQIVVASDSGAPREIIRSGTDGYMFSHSDPGVVRGLIMQIVRMEKGERSRISENAKRRVKDMYSYERVYPKKMEQLERLGRTRRPSQRFPFIRGREQPAGSGIAPDPASSAGLLSVVVPYYNMGRFVTETLESLRRVSYAPCEVLIVNDGSDDPASVEMLATIEQSYPVKVLHKKNGGLASARNAGALHARGEFLAFLDPDDLVAPDYYEWAVRILRAYDNVSFVGAWTRAFGASDLVWPAWNPELPYLLIHNTINSSGPILRRSDFLQYGMNASTMEYGWEDYEYVIRMVTQGCRGVAIPRPLHHYRIRPDSMYRQMKSATMVYSHQMIADRHKDVFAEYGVDIFNLLNSNGPSYLYDNPSFEAPQPVQYCTDAGLREIVFLGLRRLYRALPPGGALVRAIGPFRDAIRSGLLR